MDTRITVFNRSRNASLRMEVGREDPVGEVAEMAADAWGGSLVLRRGYDLLEPAVGVESVADGDTIEVLPDPFGRRRWGHIAARDGAAL